MNNKEILKFATVLDKAAAEAKAISQISKEIPFSEAEAYAIQFASMQKRFERGEQFIGLKMGFTSKAKMEQMGVHDMIWGILTDKMLIEANGSTSMSKYIHPRAEPELCFLVKEDIEQQIDAKDITQYIEGIAPALEIIDSRYEQFKFSLEDVIADNCSSSGLVVGEWQAVDTPLKNLNINLIIDDKQVQTGNSDAILGNPWESVIAATRLASKYEWKIPKGSLIMAGAATPAVYLEPGNVVKVEIENLGEASFSIL